MTLTDKVVLITGGRRIGRDVARRLAAAGAHVALSYNRSSAEAAETVAELRTTGRGAAAYSADLTDPAACARLVDTAARDFGRLDVLVNMASVYAHHSFDDMTVEHWHAALAVDLHAVFACSLAAVPHLRRAGGGRIVNVSDWVARSGRPRYVGYVGYYVAKAGVIALTEALALELARDNILVNAVAPGPIVAPPGTSDEELKAIEDATPLGRWGGGEEVARAVQALIDGDFITGETVRVDGGRHLR
jgi:NAD(P)-dependent dehydrogenase (short-subunit alcohol dehydrogenase family)